ncbi:MAG: phage tail tube protein [Solirubrobacteraceae bacterium]
MTQPFATSSSFLGLAKEVTRGTIVAPTVWLPYRGPAPEDKITYLDDKGLRGSAVEIYNKVQGVTAGDFGFSGDVFTDTFPNLLMALLGGTDAVTGAGPYTHTFSLLNSAVATGNQPPSYTLSDSDGFEMRQFANAMFSELTIKWSADGLLEYAAKASSLKSAATTNATTAFSTKKPTPGWNLVATVAASPSTHLQSGEISLKRPVKLIYTSNGTQAPYQVWAGPLTVTGKGVWVLIDDTELNYFENNTGPIADFKFTDPASTDSIDLHFNQLDFITGKITRGKEYIEVETDLFPIPNSTDATSGGLSPCKAVVINSQATAY